MCKTCPLFHSKSPELKQGISIKQLCVLLAGCYRGDVKLCVSGGLLLKLLVPFAFEVDGVDQHQPGISAHDTLDQKILDFT